MPKKEKGAGVAIVKLNTITTAKAEGHTLTKGERSLVAEALRRAEEARNVIEDTLVDFGRWVLVNVFNDDASAALARRKDNPVWSELARRAGGPTLGLSQRFLYTALALAAHDKRISDQSWRLLEPGRKELLLPLSDENHMRKAAQHVIAMKLTQRDTQKYVRAILLEQGRGSRTRVTASLVSSQVRRFRERMSDGDYRRKLQRILQHGETEERSQVRKELVALRTWLSEVLRIAK